MTTKSGTIRSFNAERGYGFISVGNEDPDVFFHVRQLADVNAKICQHDNVRFEMGEHRGRPCAVNVTLVD